MLALCAGCFRADGFVDFCKLAGAMFLARADKKRECGKKQKNGRRFLHTHKKVRRLAGARMSANGQIFSVKLTRRDTCSAQLAFRE